MCGSQSSHGHVPRISLEPDNTARGGPMATWQGPRLASVTWRRSPTILLAPHIAVEPDDDRVTLQRGDKRVLK
jgi:hypothetical protein